MKWQSALGPLLLRGSRTGVRVQPAGKLSRVLVIKP